MKPSHKLTPLTRLECAAGLLYLPLHIFAMPLLLGVFAAVSPGSLTDLQINGLYYFAGLLFVLIFMRGHLRRGFDILLDSKLRSGLSVISGYFVNILLGYGVMLIVISVLGESGNPNNALVETQTQFNPTTMAALLVLVVPVVEETLFRGVLFGSIREKSRALAYIVSVLVFAFYHIWQFLVIEPSWTTLFYIIEYIPAGFALAWCYEQSGSIWSPVILHMLINGIAVSLM